jgi:hypothetical protein
MPVIRHISNLYDGGMTYSLYDKQARAVNKLITDPSFDRYYENPSLMIESAYDN